MIGAGELDRRIRIQHAVNLNDPDYNEEIPTWIDDAIVWAKMEFHKSEESEASARRYAEMGLYFTIRYRSDLTAEHRLAYKNGSGVEEYYEIVGRPRDLGRRQFLKVQARLIE
ncbi:MAG: head-tail adaptor protein [Mesorhizobium sp.]|uniref:phage head closure protein n=1 Tax=Mesorhizobium sp. TaxID=1871066 RepID=UPI001213FD3E|nr:phage head closure protein [Mesorhizobium sp.]TIL91462.1 MAG: head-tail adaptor protein [Mesorhizobium sp.]